MYFSLKSLSVYFCFRILLVASVDCCSIQNIRHWCFDTAILGEVVFIVLDMTSPMMFSCCSVRKCAPLPPLSPRSPRNSDYSTITQDIDLDFRTWSALSRCNYLLPCLHQFGLTVQLCLLQFFTLFSAHLRVRALACVCACMCVLCVHASVCVSAQ